MFKILDKFGGEVSAEQQAVFNKISTNNSSGYVKGYRGNFAINQLASNMISIDSGILSIQGFRAVNDTLQTYTVSVTPSEPIPFQLMAVFSHYTSSEQDTLEIITRPTEALRQENLFAGSNAVYELELARFTMTAAGITDFTVTLEKLVYNEQDLSELLEMVSTAESEAATALEAAKAANNNATAAANTANAAKETADAAKAASDTATAKVAELSEQIGEKQGTTVTQNGTALANLEIAGYRLTNEDLNTLQGEDYWGKTYYGAGGNSVLNKPAGTSGFYLDILRGGVVTTVHKFTATADTTGASISPNIYIRQYINNEWTSWEQIVSADGNYPTLGAGYLATQIKITANSSALVGWNKFAEISYGTASTNYSYSAILLVNGVHALQESTNVNISESGKIEIDFYKEVSANPTLIGMSVLSGNINANEICAVLDSANSKIYLYSYFNLYQAVSYSLISEEQGLSSKPAKVVFVSEYYGTTAPTGAVYAVVRNNASELNGKAASDIFESDGVTAKKAAADGDGNNIVETYAKKTEIDELPELPSYALGDYYLKANKSSTDAEPTLKWVYINTSRRIHYIRVKTLNFTGVLTYLATTSPEKFTDLKSLWESMRNQSLGGIKYLNPASGFTSEGKTVVAFAAQGIKNTFTLYYTDGTLGALYADTSSETLIDDYSIVAFE